MTNPYDEFALLLAAPNATEAKLAQDLLSGEGIPSMLHGHDRDFAELGEAVHMAVSRQDVLVPKEALARARAVLTAAWGEVEWPQA